VIAAGSKRKLLHSSTPVLATPLVTALATVLYLLSKKMPKPKLTTYSANLPCQQLELLAAHAIDFTKLKLH
jgi:hypothetical protein